MRENRKRGNNGSKGRTRSDTSTKGGEPLSQHNKLGRRVNAQQTAKSSEHAAGEVHDAVDRNRVEGNPAIRFSTGTKGKQGQTNEAGRTVGTVCISP
jgi:hypothetical protein